MRWLLTVAWVIFVVGGCLAGWRGIENLSQRENSGQLGRSTPVRASISAVSAPEPITAPVATAPPLRDFDQSRPPFEAAGKTGPEPTPQPDSPAGRLTILLLGIDQRPDETGPGGDPGRTDSMLLVSIDYEANTAAMVSIPRDGFVVIPGHGNERVNAAYTFGELDQRGGGPALAMQTVAQVFGVPVDRYVLVDIHSMEQVIDTLGGVWIDNPTRLVDHAYPTDDYRTITVDIPAGPQHMDGVTAVEYARTRHPDSDYGRQGRQQQVLLALRDQALTLNVLPRLPQLLPQLMNLVRTDLSPVQIAHLANFGRGLDRAHDIIAVPPDPTLTPSYTGPGGASYVNFTSRYRTEVQALITQPRIAAERAEIDVFNAGAPVGSGGRTADILGRIGLVVSRIDTAASVPSTRIEAGAGARRTALMIAQTLGLAPEALILEGESSSIRVLLGPDVNLPLG